MDNKAIFNLFTKSVLQGLLDKVGGDYKKSWKKDELIDLLCDFDLKTVLSKMDTKQLKVVLSEMKLSQTGKKSVLIDRITGSNEPTISLSQDVKQEIEDLINAPFEVQEQVFALLHGQIPHFAVDYDYEWNEETIRKNEKLLNSELERIKSEGCKLPKTFQPNNWRQFHYCESFYSELDPGISYMHMYIMKQNHWLCFMYIDCGADGEEFKNLIHVEPEIKIVKRYAFKSKSCSNHKDYTSQWMKKRYWSNGVYVSNIDAEKWSMNEK